MYNRFYVYFFCPPTINAPLTAAAPFHYKFFFLFLSNLLCVQYIYIYIYLCFERTPGFLPPPPLPDDGIAARGGLRRLCVCRYARWFLLYDFLSLDGRSPMRHPQYIPISYIRVCMCIQSATIHKSYVCKCTSR